MGLAKVSSVSGGDCYYIVGDSSAFNWSNLIQMWLCPRFLLLLSRQLPLSPSVLQPKTVEGNLTQPSPYPVVRLLPGVRLVFLTHPGSTAQLFYWL